MFKCVIKNTIVFGYAMLFCICELQLWPYSAYVIILLVTYLLQ